MLSAASKRFCRRLQEDQARFSLRTGTNRFIARARARLEALPGGMDLVMAMASFCPDLRPTMLEVLRHEAFSSLRLGKQESDDTRIRGNGSMRLDFMTFARSRVNRPLENV